MAKQVTCVCGRRFYVSEGQSCQCRKCGRWWSGREIGNFETMIYLMCGREVAGTQHKKGNRKRNRNNSSRGKQTNKRRPPNNPLGAAWRLFFG
ncbi:MAG: hypothetical protein LBC74_05490 [Planctomycetaceae bacterium]|nr:hypothetical protein [Planctomycetaceae bacterium]